jgi:hypothetical protein
MRPRPGPDLRSLRGEIVDQAVGVFEIGSREFRFILDNFAAVFYQTVPGFLHIGDRTSRTGPSAGPGSM